MTKRRWLGIETVRRLEAQGRIKTHVLPQSGLGYADAELTKLGVPAVLLATPLVRLDLPMPPSANKYWVPVPTFSKSGKIIARHVLSREGKSYRREVWLAVRQAGVRSALVCRLRMVTVLHFRTHGIADIKNRCKCLDDALAYAGVYVDDSQIDHGEQIRGQIVRGGRVVVYLYENDSPCPAYPPTAPQAADV